MKYTLGRAALSRAHHMFLIHHNFSTHTCKKPEKNLNGPVSNMAAPEHWLCTSMRCYQATTMHTTHRLLQTTHRCQPARSLQEKSTAIPQWYTQKWQQLFSHQLYTSDTQTTDCNLAFWLASGPGSPPASTVCCHLWLCWTEASKEAPWQGCCSCAHTRAMTHTAQPHRISFSRQPWEALPEGNLHLPHQATIGFCLIWLL